MKKVLFVDRDGTLIVEPKPSLQIDSLEKLEFLPGVFRYLGQIARELDYELVMVTNQDGLGTDSFPEHTFWPAHNKMLRLLENEGIVFSEVLIDRSFPEDNAPTRKPRTGLLPAYLHGQYDLANSYVIGDRASDVELAKNIGAQAIQLLEPSAAPDGGDPSADLVTNSWAAIYAHLSGNSRNAEVIRNTRETKIRVAIDLNGSGKSSIQTGLHFFDHMLEQIARHGQVDLTVHCKGDLHIDEHHSVEDTAITLGQAVSKALGSKRGIERYGFTLPMDDCLAQVAVDFGGRPWINWHAEFKRERVGDVPTELFYHFFKSFSDHARCNLDIRAEGENEHHKIEAIFKAFAKACKMAFRKTGSDALPSTKGVL